jgi:predicted nucleotidyltransferase
VNKIKIHRLDFFGSFFVKKKRKENRIISQIEIIVRIMNLFRILIGGTKA